MKLRSSIKRILKEESKLSPRLRRRVSFDEIESVFIDSFNYAYNLTKKRKVLTVHFLDVLISTTINSMMDSFHWKFVSKFPDSELWYNEISKELENYYRKRIVKMYKEKEGINESILKEETEIPIRLRRRLNFVDDLVTYWASKRVKECGRFSSDFNFLRFIVQDVIEDMYYTHFEDIDDESVEWKKMYITMEKYITEKFGNSIKNVYHINCGD